MISTTPAKIHILIVDDDRLVLASLSRGLQEAGYRVTEASNGEDGFNLAEKLVPDLALLDVRMPGMSGIELGRLLRQHTGIPYLFLSAFGHEEIVKSAAEHGALGYLVKPLDIPQILPSIETALARATEIRGLNQGKAQLNTALTSSREINMAVGLLMMRDRIDRKAAFDLLRANARANRRSVAAVASELLTAAEKLYAVAKPDDNAPRRRRSDT